MMRRARRSRVSSPESRASSRQETKTEPTEGEAEPASTRDKGVPVGSEGDKE
jgi:hypothetical protein